MTSHDEEVQLTQRLPNMPSSSSALHPDKC